MSQIRIFEPPLCCNTGVCGQELDQELVDFTANVQALKNRGVDIERTNLASDPEAFAVNPTVVAFLEESGSEGLPLVLVDGAAVLSGRRPTRDELLRFAGPTEAPREELPLAGQCCSDGTCTCSENTCTCGDDCSCGDAKCCCSGEGECCCSGDDDCSTCGDNCSCHECDCADKQKTASSCCSDDKAPESRCC